MSKIIYTPRPKESLLDILIRLITGKKKSLVEQILDKMI